MRTNVARIKDQCILCVAISMSFSIHFAFKYAYTIKNMCRALKSYFRSIGMIPSCRIQSLINQQSYTKYTIARLNSAHAIRYLNFDSGTDEVKRIQNTGGSKGYQFLYIKTKINIYVAFSLYHFAAFDGYSIKAYKMHCFCWKGGSYSFTNCTFPNIHIICFVQTQFCFRWTKYIAQYMYHK